MDVRYLERENVNESTGRREYVGLALNSRVDIRKVVTRASCAVLKRFELFIDGLVTVKKVERITIVTFES